MKTLLEAGENEQALVLFFSEVAEFTPSQLDALRSARNWPVLVEAVHTVLRESYVEEGYTFEPVRFREMTTPTLLLSGSESPQFLEDATEAVNDTLTNSRISALEGQGHVAMNTAPDLFIDAVLAFIYESS